MTDRNELLARHAWAGPIDRMAVKGKGWWSPQARHAVVVIETSASHSQAVLIDDDGPRGSIDLTPDKIDEFLGAMSRAWLERGTGGSFSVTIQHRAAAGTVTPTRPPTPPPGPIGHDVLFAAVLTAHAQLNVVRQLAQRNGLLGEVAEQQR